MSAIRMALAWLRERGPFDGRETAEEAEEELKELEGKVAELETLAGTRHGGPFPSIARVCPECPASDLPHIHLEDLQIAVTR